MKRSGLNAEREFSCDLTAIMGSHRLGRKLAEPKRSDVRNSIGALRPFDFAQDRLSAGRTVKYLTLSYTQTVGAEVPRSMNGVFTQSDVQTQDRGIEEMSNAV